MNNEYIDKLKAYGINPADYDEFEMEEIADTLNTYEEKRRKPTATSRSWKPGKNPTTATTSSYRGWPTAKSSACMKITAS